MTVKFLFLILSFGLASVATPAQDSYRPGKKNLSWGAEAGGLRIAVWTSPAGDKLFAAVRNSSTRMVCFCAPQEVREVSYWVYARKNPASEWQELKIKPPVEEYIFLPLCHSKDLKPGEEMPSLPSETGPQKKVHSFIVNLRGFSFPPDWNGTADIKIVLSVVYCNRSKNNLGKVESRPFEIMLPLAETAPMQTPAR